MWTWLWWTEFDRKKKKEEKIWNYVGEWEEQRKNSGMLCIGPQVKVLGMKGRTKQTWHLYNSSARKEKMGTMLIKDRGKIKRAECCAWIIKKLRYQGGKKQSNIKYTSKTRARKRKKENHVDKRERKEKKVWDVYKP